ncbi:MAG: hypothetical protein WD757_00575 [Actinomycetota bacterium]
MTKDRLLFGIVGIAVGLVLAIFLSEVAGDGTTEVAPSVQESPEGESPAAFPEDVEPTIPRPSDFEIGVKILQKQCFGSAGCNITYRVVPRVKGGPPLPEDATVEVVYEVVGGEDGPVINNFTITGDSASVEQEELLSTSSSGARLKARATDVSILY